MELGGSDLLGLDKVRRPSRHLVYMILGDFHSREEWLVIR